MLTKSRHTRRITIMESDKIVRNTQVVDSEWLEWHFIQMSRRCLMRKNKTTHLFIGHETGIFTIMTLSN